MATHVDPTTGPPPLDLLVRARQGCQVLRLKPNAGELEQLPLKVPGSFESCEYDGAATRFALCTRDKAEVCDAATGKVLLSVEGKKFLESKISSKGKYVALWASPGHEGKPENLFVYNVETKEQVMSRHEPLWPCIDWSVDDKVTIVNHPFQGVLFFEDPKADPVKVLPGRWSVMEVAPTSPPVLMAVAVPPVKERDTKPTRIAAVRYPNIEKPIVDQEIKADDVTVLWNKKGTAALVTAQLDQHSAGTSYYGETALFLYQTQQKKVVPIPTGKTAIHDAQWSQNGKEFIVIFGRMPNNEAHLYDEKGALVHKFEIGPKNTVHWHHRFFFLAGFGNLAGNVEVYDRERLNVALPEKPSGVIGRFSTSSVTRYSFSPCARYILCATCHPRMTTANRVAIYKHNGVKVCEMPYNELYSATWRPHAPKLFPVRDPSPPPAGMTTKPVEAPKKVFRAAGCSALAANIKSQLAVNKSAPSATKYSSSVNTVGKAFDWRAQEQKNEDKQFKAVPGSAPAEPPKPKKPTIVGMDYDDEEEEAPKKKEKKPKAAVEVTQNEKKDFEKEKYPDVQKALSKAKKAVQGCGQLRNKDPATLNKEQQAKLANFENFKAEVAYLEKLNKAGVKSQ